MMNEQKTFPVGIGEILATTNSLAVLAAFGLGSCVGLALYDPIVKCGGMAHILLPSSNESTYPTTGFRFADTAVAALVKELSQLGAMPRRIVCKIAGGAQMLSGPGHVDTFRIGERNVAAVKVALRQLGLTPVATETGGAKGRTMRLHVATGQVFVRTAGNGEMEL